MQIVLTPRCLPAVEMSTKVFQLQIFSQESSKINKYFLPLFLTNHWIQSLLPAQTRKFQFPFAQHRKEVGNADKKSKICQTLVEMFQFLANCK